MSALSWLLASRSSTIIARHGVPTYAMDAITRGLAASGFALVSTQAAAQAASYREVAAQDREARFEPVVRPRHAALVHSVTVRLRPDATVRVTVGFGATKTPQVLGGLIAGLVAWGLFALRGDITMAGALLYYPLAIAIVCLVMPGKTNADATKAIVATIEQALEAEKARAVDSVRRRVEAPTGPRVEAPATAPEEATAPDEAERRVR
jgi:hypothetical protein